MLISECVVVDNRFLFISKRVKRKYKRFFKEVKKFGEVVIKGYRSYDLMFNL